MLLASAVLRTISVDVQVVSTAHQVKFVIQTTSATFLACQSEMIVQQRMEMTSMPAVCLAFAAVQTTSVDVQATVTALQTKYAKHLIMHVSLSSIGYLLIVLYPLD